MAVYTSIGRGELEALLAHCGLGSLERYAGIPAGIVNTNYEVHAAGGHFVLTLFERLPARELAYFLALIDHLRRQGVPCAAPVHDRAGAALHTLAGRPAVLFEWIEGASLRVPGPADCACIGEVLAAMHVAARGFPLTRASDWSLAWMERSVARLAPRLTDGLRTLLASGLDQARALASTDLPRGTIHGDLFRDNVLFTGARVSGVIDFYYACTDVLLHDLAVAVNDWCIDEAGELDAERANALLAAYHRARPLLPAERKAWPRSLQVAALQFLLSRLCDLHFPRPGELLTPKSPLEFQRILAARAREGASLRAVWPEAGG